MRLSTLAVLVLAACAPPHVPQSDVAGSGGPVPAAFVQRMAMGGIPPVAGTVLGVPGVAPASEFQLFLLLSGQPNKLGVLTSTGTSVTNATTGVPFTVQAADCSNRVFLFKCDTAQANVGAGATCDTTVTSANHRYQIAGAFEGYWMISAATTFCLDAPAATTINCAVFCML